jgi:hypothetical protein
MKTTARLLVIALVVGLSTPLAAQLSRDAAIAKAEALLKNLQEGRTAAIVKEFDDRMSKELPEARLKPAWSGLIGQFGAFKRITERREGMVEGRQAVELILAFEKETIVHRTVFDANGKVDGLVFRPATAAVLHPQL